MYEQEFEQEVKRITNRHIAKCLSRLDEINCPSMIKETVKRNYWHLSNDIKHVKIETECGEGRNGN